MGAIWCHADQAAGRVTPRFRHSAIEPGRSAVVILDGVLADEW